MSVLFLTTGALFFLAGGCAAGQPPSSRPIVIGADLELSGPGAAIGGVYQQALQLKVEEINAQGGVDGRPLRLRVQGNHGDPETSARDVAGFAGDAGVAAVVMGACSACAVAAAATIDQRKVPTISLAPATEVATPLAQRRFLFKLGPNAEDSAALLATELANDRLRHVSILASDDVDGHGAAAALRSEVVKSGGSVLATQFFTDAPTGAGQAVRAALAAAPQALVVSAFPGDASAVALAVRDAGFTGRLFFTSVAAGDLFLTGPGARATENAVMAAPQSLVIDDVIATTPAKAERRRWFTDYMSRFGQFSGYSTYAADAVQLIADAVHAAGGTDRGRLRDSIEGSQFDGVSGPIRFTAENHSGVMPQAVTSVVARSSRWRLLG